MMHWTSLYSAPPPPDIGTHCTVTPTPTAPPAVTCGGQDWRPVQTCSPEDPPPPPIYFAIEAQKFGTSGRSASNWNAFLSYSLF